jgi:cytochrome oxidase Cu insertion factor (SCO1/SenC/PrrC family)
MHLSLPRTAPQLALGFLLSAALVTGTAPARAVSPVEPPKGLAAAPPGTRMPAFELPGIDGTKVRATDLRDKVTVIRFWATW